MNDFMPPMPDIPPTPGAGSAISTIIKILKLIGNIFLGSVKKIGSIDSINDQSSADDIERILRIFEDIYSSVHSHTQDIEKTVCDEVSSYAKVFADAVRSRSDITEKYGIDLKRTARCIDKFPSEINGIIDDYVSKRFSLSDFECRAIMKMQPGLRKEKAISDFTKKMQNEALDEYCEALREALNEVSEEIADEVMEAVDSLRKQCKILKDGLSTISESDYTETSEKQISDSRYIIGICDLTCEIL